MFCCVYTVVTKVKKLLDFYLISMGFVALYDDEKTINRGYPQKEAIMKKFFQHIVNLVARLWFFCTKANFISSFAFGYEDRTATISLPGTKFAELFCEREGYKPLRFAVGRLDASTEVVGIDTGAIKLRCGDQKWESSITEFLKGLHFSR